MKPLVTVLAGLFLCAGNLSPGLAADDPMAPAAGQLVIVKAVYGDLPTDVVNDVTKKVAKLVKDNTLTVMAANLNFGDPAEGVTKKLKVDYTLDGQAGSITVSENETLKLPAAAK